MSIYSKVYSVKSNAARAAKPHGLTRADLEACEGGWRFAMPNIADELPEPVMAVEAAPAELATETPTEPEPAPETAAPHGWDMVEPGPENHGEPEAISAEVEAADAMMAAIKNYTSDRVFSGKRRLSEARTKKLKKDTEGADEDKPKGGPGRRRKENGIGKKVIGELRTNWTTIDDLVEMTGWEPHTTRAYISVQSRKLGLQAERKRVEGVTSYRIL